MNCYSCHKAILPLLDDVLVPHVYTFCRYQTTTDGKQQIRHHIFFGKAFLDIRTGCSGDQIAFRSTKTIGLVTDSLNTAKSFITSGQPGERFHETSADKLQQWIDEAWQPSSRLPEQPHGRRTHGQRPEVEFLPRWDALMAENGLTLSIPAQQPSVMWATGPSPASQQAASDDPPHQPAMHTLMQQTQQAQQHHQQVDIASNTAVMQQGLLTAAGPPPLHVAVPVPLDAAPPGALQLAQQHPPATAAALPGTSPPPPQLPLTQPTGAQPSPLGASLQQATATEEASEALLFHNTYIFTTHTDAMLITSTTTQQLQLNQQQDASASFPAASGLALASTSQQQAQQVQQQEQLFHHLQVPGMPATAAELQQAAHPFTSLEPLISSCATYCTAPAAGQEGVAAALQRVLGRRDAARCDRILHVLRYIAQSGAVVQGVVVGELYKDFVHVVDSKSSRGMWRLPDYYVPVLQQGLAAHRLAPGTSAAAAADLERRFHDGINGWWCCNRQQAMKYLTDLWAACISALINQAASTTTSSSAAAPMQLQFIAHGTSSSLPSAAPSWQHQLRGGGISSISLLGPPTSDITADQSGVPQRPGSLFRWLCSGLKWLLPCAAVFAGGFAAGRSSSSRPALIRTNFSGLVGHTRLLNTSVSNGILVQRTTARQRRLVQHKAVGGNNAI